jgi:hypothetical protein
MPLAMEAQPKDTRKVSVEFWTFLRQSSSRHWLEHARKRTGPALRRGRNLHRRRVTPLALRCGRPSLAELEVDETPWRSPARSAFVTTGSSSTSTTAAWAESRPSNDMEPASSPIPMV